MGGVPGIRLNNSTSEHLKHLLEVLDVIKNSEQGSGIFSVISFYCLTKFAQGSEVFPGTPSKLVSTADKL